MPDQSHDTMSRTYLQADQLIDDWTQEVVARFPEGTEEQAKALKAFERSRKIGSATDLLRGLLAYVSTTHSFLHLGMWSLLINLADVSATDWRTRLQKASQWANWLLQELLAASSAMAPGCCEQGSGGSCSLMEPISNARGHSDTSGACTRPLIW
jgi:hypothetical protein